MKYEIKIRMRGMGLELRIQKLLYDDTEKD